MLCPTFALSTIDLEGDTDEQMGQIKNSKHLHISKAHFDLKHLCFVFLFFCMFLHVFVMFSDIEGYI